MTQAPGRAYPQTGVAAFTTRQRAAVNGADGATPMDQLTGEQSSAALGDPIPLVFCNRVDGVGGVWIDPPATFARFENDESDTLTVSYHLVLSEGQLGGVSCVWQGTERRAGPGAEAVPGRPLADVTWEYGQRAGDWHPGLFINQNWTLATQTNTQDVTGAAVASEAEIPEARASVKLTSKSDYVTRFEFTAKMIDWGSRIPALISGKNNTGEESGGFSIPSSYTNETKPLRSLGNWSFSRERSTEVQRIELDHVEDVYWEDKYIPQAVYRCTILEESIEPGRIYETPAYIGNDRGSYQGMSTLSFVDVYPVGTDTYGQPVHVFIEDGAQVAPLLGGPEAEASSNLLPDLARYLMVRRGRPAELIDTDALTESARFNQANGLLFNGVLAVPTNLRDYLFRVAPYYLLRVSNRGGAAGLRPAVPTDETGAIDLGPVSPVLTLTEDHILPGSFDQDIIGLEERRPFIAVGLWREQPLDEIGIPRATEVRRSSTPDDANVEQFDLTEFCVTEDHAVKALIYQLSRRSNITHRLSVAVRPEPEIAALATGDILRVRYQRMVAGPAGGVSVHDFFYELDQVETADEGAVVLRLTHYPVTDMQESVFAAEVVRGFESREGFAWSDAPAEYGNNTIDPGAGATEDRDLAKDPPIPFGGVASFGEPEFITTGAPAVVVKVCMDKPAQTEDMLLRLTSQLQAFNNQIIKIGIGQQCGQVEVPVDGTESGTVGILGYTGGGYVNPDLSDTITLGTAGLGMAAVLWTEDETTNSDGQLAGRTVTVRNAAGSGSVSFSYDIPTFPVPEDAWFAGANGTSTTTDGAFFYSWPQSSGSVTDSFPLSTMRIEGFGVDRHERKTAFCLPLNAESAIFVYRSRGAASFWHKRVESVSTFKIPPWRVAASPVEFQFTPDEIVTTTLSTDFSESPDEWAVTRCFLVTASGVAEVTPPSGLITALQQYEPEGYSLASSSVGTYLPSGTRSMVEPPTDDFPLYWTGATSEPDYYPDYFQLNPSVEDRGHPAFSFSWGTVSNAVAYAIDNTFDFGTAFAQPVLVDRLQPVGEPPSFSDFRDSIPLLTCYGIGALASSAHSSAGSTPLYSPAMFTFLAEVNSSILSGYGDIFDYQDAMQETNAGYAYIQSTYLASAPAPSTFYAPCALFGSCPVDSPDGVNLSDLADSYVRFDEAIVAPASHDVALTVPGDFTAGSVSITLESLTGAEQLIYSWDWQQPDYCRDQLLALGFTGADLTP